MKLVFGSTELSLDSAEADGDDHQAETKMLLRVSRLLRQKASPTNNTNRKQDMNTTADTATSKKQRVIALMSPEALKCVAAARPTVKHALTGAEIHCRSLGKTEGMQQLDQSEVMPDDMIIGFSIPINLSARAHHCVEIPVGKTENGFNPRMEASGRLNTDRQKLLIEKLNETGRFALRAYKSEITEAFPDAKDDVPDEVQAEMTVEF